MASAAQSEDDRALSFPFPKITDLGLGKLQDAQEESTRSGAILGTPSYMAPEQAEGRSDTVGTATDVWGLSAILYEVLTERPPIKGATVLETLEQVRSQEPLPPSRLHANLPRDLETICLKCLEIDPPSGIPQPRRWPMTCADSPLEPPFMPARPIGSDSWKSGAGSWRVSARRACTRFSSTGP